MLCSPRVQVWSSFKPCMMMALNLELNFYFCQMQSKHIGKFQPTFCPEKTNVMYRYQPKQANIRVVSFIAWTKVLFYTIRSRQYAYFLISVVMWSLNLNSDCTKLWLVLEQIEPKVRESESTLLEIFKNRLAMFFIFIQSFYDLTSKEYFSCLVIGSQHIVTNFEYNLCLSGLLFFFCWY